MLVLDAQFAQAYDAVKEELLRQTDLERKVPIFVSAVDCDSVCALRILAVSVSTLRCTARYSTAGLPGTPF